MPINEFTNLPLEITKMTFKDLLQAELDRVNADLEANPAVADPRLQKKANLEADLAGTAAWYETDIDVIRALFAKYL